jgi:hypothetical protein
MKFSNIHFESLKSSIASSDIDLTQTKKRYDVLGYSETRFLWDIFWATSFHKDPSFREANYKDLHIQTAIKKAILELTK